MVKLAICDDEKNDLEALISCVEDYSIERRTDITYEAFTTYMELEKRIGEFDIFFMDYTMPGIDGLTYKNVTLNGKEQPDGPVKAAPGSSAPLVRKPPVTWDCLN